MSGTNMRVGLAAQVMIGTNALHDPLTPVVVDTALEFDSQSVVDTVPIIERMGLTGGSPFARSGRVRPVPTGKSTGDVVQTLWTTGAARELWHIFGGYAYTWPGSTNATGTLTLAAIPTANDTMTIGSQVYTFKTALTTTGDTANEVLIGASIALSLSYLAAAINRDSASDGKGSRTCYGSATPRNADVSATATPTTVVITDRKGRGAAANSVATTETFTNAGNIFAGVTLTGGVNGTDTARLHTYTFDTNRLRELEATMQLIIPPRSALRATHTRVGKPVTTVWSCALDGALMFTPTWDFLSIDTDIAIGTATYPATATFFDYTQVVVAVAGEQQAVQGVDLTLTSMQTSTAMLGTATGRLHLITDRPTITGNFTREFEDTTLYDAWLAGEETSVIITATGNTIPGSALPYQTTLTIADILYEGSTPTVDGPGVVQNNVPFRGLDNGTDPPIQLTYQSDEGHVGDDGAA